MLKNRLTRYDKNKKKFLLPQGRGVWRSAADNLGAYEDTGMTPEEIIRLKRDFDVLTRKLKQAEAAHSDTENKQYDLGWQHAVSFLKPF